jgi:serine phosphatase RsbU (regulator of sigma subunit)
MLDWGAALTAARDADPESVPDIVASVAAVIDATDLVVYLVDFAQATLEPMPNRSTHADIAQSEAVASTMAGRAFLDRRPVTADRAGHLRVWVPIIEGSDRTGVLALTVADGSSDILAACETLGLLTGYLIGIHTRATDVYNVHRRRRAMSLPASMQWDLLPPLVLNTERVSLAGLIEPAYDVGGDGFDYAVNGSTCDLAVFDAMGHNLNSALLAALAVGTYRHQRREGATLEVIHHRLDNSITSQHSDLSFVTGQLVRLNLTTGVMQWTNAGHPLPLLVRNGHVVSEVTCEPTPPWGLGTLAGRTGSTTNLGTPHVASVALEPGDMVLFYSDGSIDAHTTSGEPFGVERLADLVGRHASDNFEPERIVRQLTRSVLEHHKETLTDDATFVVMRWNGNVVGTTEAKVGQEQESR